MPLRELAMALNNEIIELKNIVFTDDYIKDIKSILVEAKKQSYKTVNLI